MTAPSHRLVLEVLTEVLTEAIEAISQCPVLKADLGG